MNEIIQSIKDVDDFKMQDHETYDSGYEGFEIVTDKQRILFGISNQSGCCESWGHVASEDKLEDFVGAELLEIAVVDDALNKKVLEGVGDIYDGGAVFVDVLTSKGKLQFAVYNSHNGYYGHTVRLQSNQLTLETGA